MEQDNHGRNHSTVNKIREAVNFMRNQQFEVSMSTLLHIVLFFKYSSLPLIWSSILQYKKKVAC